MHSTHLRMAATLLFGMALLAGCGDMKMKVWPFGDSSPRERSREPSNAAEYLCAAGKRFHVRMIEGGAAAWLILPEREVRLERIGESTTRYGKGALLLELGAENSSLTDGASISHATCKPAAEAGNR